VFRRISYNETEQEITLLLVEHYGCCYNIHLDRVDEFVDAVIDATTQAEHNFDSYKPGSTVKYGSPIKVKK